TWARLYAVRWRAHWLSDSLSFTAPLPGGGHGDLAQPVLDRALEFFHCTVDGEKHRLGFVIHRNRADPRDSRFHQAALIASSVLCPIQIVQMYFDAGYAVAVPL